LLGQILQLQVQKSAGYEYKKQVADYETRLEQIRRDLIAKALEQLGRSGQDPNCYPPLYWFELSPFWKDNWGMTRMRPMPDFVPYIYILPDEMVKLISRETPSPGNIAEFYNGGDGKLIRPVKYWVVRLSSGHIAGIALMDMEKIREGYRFEDSPVVTGLYSAYWALDRFLHQNPDDVKELAFRFQEAFANGTFDPVVLPTPEISLLSFIRKWM